MQTNRANLLKKLDAIIGSAAASIFPLPERREPSLPIASLLIIRPGGIGDAVLLAPAIRLLKINNPALNITVLAEKRNCGVFALISGVDRLLCYDRRGELLNLLRCRFDVVIDTEQSHRLSAVVARLVAAPVKIGFATNERRRMFTHQIPYLQEDYEAVSFAHLLEPLRVGLGSADLEAPFLAVPELVAQKVADMLAALHGEVLVAVFPGASIPERRWGAGRFRQVAELLAAFGIKVVVVGGKEDHQQGEVITGGGLGLNLAGLTSLSETAAVIGRSSLLLSGDSGVLHIAVGLGKPTVSLFGPGRALKWAPQGDGHLVIDKRLPCSPCTTFGNTPPCPDDARCMREISVDEVANAITMLLTSVNAMPSRCCKRDWIEIP
jgi:ADP-heptose:LPS heptosyltransferase